ncbi:VOC family protein [Phenylobacterium hankyongense]|uniref:VOC family protein n=1 Tax=Phenylobacterium hankyongense TaxID=1813876 RepID=A0A328AXV9_9CAUL|nr:VOC family protein [Phenylobacterium hankyongense]RAK59437.1 VOC family protein [Phenylobacterium hankyongense]
MSVELNHTIVHSVDREAAARFLAETLDLPAPQPFGPFLVVRTANGVSLDFMTSPRPIAEQHYAFLVSDGEFDAIFGRLKQRGVDFWADPMRRRPNEINTGNGGRGVYFLDPSGHALEILTRA